LKIGAHKVKLTQPLFSMIYLYQEKLEDTKWAIMIRSRKSKKDRQYNDQKKKDIQRSTKHYTR